MKSLAGKLVVLAGIAAALLVGIASIRGVLEDRLRYRAEALESVGESLAGAQRVAGVVLAVPYTEVQLEEEVQLDGRRRQVERSVRRELLVMPESLDVGGTLAPDERRRGLFQVNGYVYTGRLTGTLRMPDLASLPRATNSARVEPGVPRLLLAVGDVRGLRAVAIGMNGKALDVVPGTGLAGAGAGVSAPLIAIPAGGSTLTFDATLTLGGAYGFEVVPLGKSTRASLASPWPHPSFTGRFLPVERTVRDSGFDARWQATALATTAREDWRTAAQSEPANASAAAAAMRLDTFEVSLIDPVDVYALTDRATKYAVLFVALTLGVFAIYETLRRMRVHPLQYLLVGAALVVFFLLLLALSEHVGFALAYVIAAAACVLLLGTYVAGVLRSATRGAAFGAGVGVLYGALYGIVQSEQNALLLGALLVFGILAAVMLLTRRVDWAALLDGRAAASG
jgi:inner membrane protein